MAQIKIYSDTTKGCIFFEGSTVDPKFIGTVVAIAHPTLANRIVIKRTDKLLSDGISFRTMFRKLRMQRIQNRDGQDLHAELGMTRAEIIEYLNGQFNDFTSGSGSGTALTLDDTPSFSRDAQGTTILIDNGDAKAINSIRALLESDGTISIKSHGETDITYYSNIDPSTPQIDGVAIPGGPQDVVDALNELFTSGPFESVVIRDPYSTMVADVDGELAGYTLEGSGVVDPIGNDLAAGMSTHNNKAGILSTATINQAGEYFTFDIRVRGQIGFGLVIANDNWQDFVVGSQTYGDPSTFCNGVNSSHYGFQFSHYFHPTPNGPWTNYGASTSYVGGPGWTTNAGRFSNNEESTDWANGDPVKMKVGIDTNGFIEIAYYDNSESAWVMCSRSAYTAPEGAEYKLGVKLPNSLVRLYSAPRVHELAIDSTPTEIGDTSIDAFGDVSGNLADGVIVTTASGRNDGIITVATIDSLGKYFEFEASADESHNVGLFSDNDYSVATVQADTADWDEGKYFFFGSKINTNEQYNSTTYKTASGAGITVSTIDRPTACVKYRVGFDLDGRATLWSSTDGTNFVVSHRMNVAAPTGDYKLIWRGTSSGSTLSSVSTGELSAAPTLYYRYIESPDGNFQYPLFASEEEANYVDTLNGGTGTSHTHVFVDDSTGTTWYMPDNGAVHNGTSEPTGPESYTEILSLSDSDLRPTAFLALPLNVTEGDTINLQTQPADTTYTTTATGLPSGLSMSAGSIVGTAPFVTEDTEYTATIIRTNSYGSTSGTLTINVANSSTLSSITGFTVNKGNTKAPFEILPTESANLTSVESISPGEEFQWSHKNYTVGGFLNSTGQAVVGTASDMSDNNSYWDVQLSLWNGHLNHASYFGHGWAGSGNTVGNIGIQEGDLVTLKYRADGFIELYTQGVLRLTSAVSYSGAKNLFFCTRNAYNVSVFAPELNKVITGAGSTTPPAGFNDPLTSGTMYSTTLLGGEDDSVATITQSLEVNHRYIIPDSWIEANVLPNMDTDGAKFFFGVPKSAADWSDIELHTDFWAVLRLERTSSSAHSYFMNIRGANPNSRQGTINSMTDAAQSYAIEWDGEDLHLLSSSGLGLLTQPSVNNGGTFSYVNTFSGFGAETSNSNSTLDLVIAVDDGARCQLTTSGLTHFRVPFQQTRDVLVGESSDGAGRFGPATVDRFEEAGSHAPSGLSYSGITSLAAGATYRFIYDPSMEANDLIEFRLASDQTTVYNTGVTSFDHTTNGDPADSATQGYKGVTFAVPADAPPLRLYFKNNSFYDNGRDIAISGSTYVTPVTGITHEGPATLSGTVASADTWYSIDETLAAGERLVFDGTFLRDIFTEMNQFDDVYIGIKDTAWANTKVGGSYGNDGGFEGGIALRLYIGPDGPNKYLLQVMQNASAGITGYRATSSLANVETYLSAFLEITNSGNNVRVAATSSQYNSDDVENTTYSNWGSSSKLQSGDQGYGITSRDVMIFWNRNESTAGDFDYNEVDWTGLSEVSVPAAPPTNQTPWTKALDFSGSNQRAQQVSNNYFYNPMKMGNVSAEVQAPSTIGYTSNGTNSRPWATSCMFKIDGHSSNQHIWNLGEGAGGTDDNIYLRLSSTRGLYFGWGRDGSLNELYIGVLSTSLWYNVYVGHNGARYSGANATTANLASAFDIRLMHSGNSFSGYTQYSTESQWGSSYSTTGGRMDRQFTGDLTIGGRGSNRNFHGKIASFVTTTLMRNVAMPGTTEIDTMVKDPISWVEDYKVGNQYRRPYYSGNASNFARNNQNSYSSTQVWLMGDGTSDSYSNMIRNYIATGDQNYTKLNMISMVSNDIETVSINGLS